MSYGGSQMTDSASTTEPGFRQKLRRWMRPPRRLSFTRAGKFFVLITLGVGFGAINTGNNLLFFLLGMLLSLIIASGILSEAVIRGLAARRTAPKRLFAGIPAPGEFTVDNEKGYASLSVEITERKARAAHGPLSGTAIGPTHVPWWKFWTSSSSEGELEGAVASAYAMRIEAEEEQDLDTRYRFPQRGAYELAGLDVTTRFPFSLFEKVRELDAPEKVIVFPSPTEPDDWMASVSARFGDVAQNERGMGEEYFGLREYRPGEDKRLIHWKSSARRGETVVRETEREEQRAVEIWVKNCTGRDAAERHLVESRFEHGLQKVVGLVQRLSASGFRVGLRTLEERIELAEDAADLDRLLGALAVCELHDGHRSFQQAAPPDETTGTILVGLPSAPLTEDVDLVLEMDSEHGPARTAEPPQRRAEAAQ